MGRCRCLESSCTCVLHPGAGIQITGDGTSGSPWVISAPVSAAGALLVEDTATLDLALAGQGTPANPYRVSGEPIIGPLLGVADTASLALALQGAGSVADPYVLSGEISLANAIAFLDGQIDWTVSGTGTVADPFVVVGRLACFNCDAPATPGDVLTAQPDGSWAAGPPVTTAPGLINTGAGLSGDGSVGNPLRVDACTYADLRTLCATP